MRRAFRKSLFGLLYLFAFIKHCTVYIVRVVIRGGRKGEAAVAKVEGFVEVGKSAGEYSSMSTHLPPGRPQT